MRREPEDVPCTTARHTLASRSSACTLKPLLFALASHLSQGAVAEQHDLRVGDP
jgi:hypothetical protein